MQSSSSTATAGVTVGDGVDAKDSVKLADAGVTTGLTLSAGKG